MDKATHKSVDNGMTVIFHSEFVFEVVDEGDSPTYQTGDWKRSTFSKDDTDVWERINVIL